MGCNCGKKKTPPPTTTSTPPAGDAKTTVVASGTAATQTFSLLTTDSRTLVFGSRLEAEAARVRQGGRVVPNG